ncbi:hypothetical protein ABPG72_016900 [Tetrahymena utriculariae]
MNKFFICAFLLLALTSANPIRSYFESFFSTSTGSCSCSGIEAMVAESEGKKSCVYLDTKGIPTIGIGFNLQRSDARSLISNLGLNYDQVVAGKQCLTDAQITSLFNNDLVWAKAGAANCVGSFNSQPTCIQNVLIDMTFNMGKSSLCSWPNFVKQLAAKDYAGAAANMQGSSWCGQVKNRCTRDVNIVKNC